MLTDGCCTAVISEVWHITISYGLKKHSAWLTHLGVCVFKRYFQGCDATTATETVVICNPDCVYQKYQWAGDCDLSMCVDKYCVLHVGKDDVMS